MKAKLAVMVVALALMWGLKRLYADARVDGLWWVLQPTAQLAGFATGTSFVMEPGEGFFSRERLFVIEKSCAGINFMIAAFGMLTFVLGRRIGSLRSGAGVLATSLLASYVAAVLVNTTRIALAIWFAGAPVAGLSSAQVHRLEGIAVYFGGLVLLHDIARRTTSMKEQEW